METKLTEEAIFRLKGNNKALGALCIILDRHMKTIENWLSQPGGHKKLVRPECVDEISKYTGLSSDQILREG